MIWRYWQNGLKGHKLLSQGNALSNSRGFVFRPERAKARKLTICVTNNYIQNNINPNDCCYSCYSYLYDQTGQADWGYNAIANGGNQENFGWRTLTNDEWGYVFNSRTGAASKWGHGNVNGVNGMILLPDVWMLPEGLSFTSGNSSWANIYNAEQWSQMEANGAVFLPAAGSRDGTSLDLVGSGGYYWSSSYDSGSNACRVVFSSGYLNPQSNNYRYGGYNVRLVRPAEN